MDAVGDLPGGRLHFSALQLGGDPAAAEYCLEITAASIGEGFLPILSELEQILEEEEEIAAAAVESGDWMPDLG